jgi:DnaJ family protein C protein 7
MIGDMIEAETTISKLEQLEPSKQSITTELNKLAHLKRFIKEAEDAYNIEDYRKV